MKLTREECKNALIELFYDEDGCMRDGLTYEFDILEQLINEHFELVEEHEKLKRMLNTFK